LKKMNELDEEDNQENNVFKGNAVGLYIDNNRCSNQQENTKLKPEQMEGEFIVSGHSMRSIVRQNPYDQNHSDRLQIICD
jgi:hypothetical protein